MPSGRISIDITGKKIGKLTALSFEKNLLNSKNRKKEFWNFKCKCGKFIIAEKHNNYKSCGCSKIGNVNGFKKGVGFWTGKIRSLEVKEKIRNRLLGRKLSEETKKKMSISGTGKMMSFESRRKMSISKIGYKNYRWNPNREEVISNKHDNTNAEYHIWARKVKNRDYWKCRIYNNDCFGRLEAHHILNWVEYVELRYEINNGITLCQAHHPRGRAEEKRLIPVLRELVSVSSGIYSEK